MASFIVISISERLHYIVDGIIRCRPLNKAIPFNVCTGKIQRVDKGYSYEYTIPGQPANKDTKVRLCDCLANQVAQFRRTCNIQPNQTIGIFVLDNPADTDEYKRSQQWLDEFDALYNKGITAFSLYHVLLTYDVQAPGFVACRTERSILKKAVERYESPSANLRKYTAKLFFLDNIDKSEAAVWSSKEDHDLMLPRFLNDFMMLASSPTDNYNVVNSIQSTDTDCFSVGYAECMYYYPDVENYFVHACIRDLLSKCLNEDDEATECNDEEAMDVEKRPFGLNNREQRMKKLYAGVPYTKDITRFPETADAKIDNAIVCLKQLLIEKRAKEEAEYDRKCQECDKRVEEKENALSNASQGDEESAEEFGVRRERIRTELENARKKRESMTFTPKCPCYIDRSAILENYRLSNKEQASSCDIAQYERLLDYVCTPDFKSFAIVEKDTPIGSGEIADEEIPIEEELSNRPGCLSFLLFWKKKEQENWGAPSIPNTTESNESERESKGAEDAIKKIIYNLYLKKQYKGFKKKIDDIRQEWEKEKVITDNFKLTRHSKCCSSLIKLAQLRKEQENKSDGLLKTCIDKWRGEDKPTLFTLKEEVEKATKDLTQKNYPYVNWQEPFSFVETDTNILASIYDDLQRHSLPYAHYTLYNVQGDDPVISCIYSDRPNFDKEITSMTESGKLQNGNQLGHQKSTHIASKIVAMQFLPMDKNVINRLSALADPDPGECTLSSDADASAPSETTCTTDGDSPENGGVDWGEF